MRERSINTIMWLDLYSSWRLNGATVYGAIEAITSGTEVAEGSREGIIAAAKEGTEKGKATADSVANAMLAASPVVASIPVVGTIAGAVMAAIGGIMKGVLSFFTFECDEYDCAGTTSYARRALIGKNAPPASNPIQNNGECNYMTRYKCALARYMHDGAVVDGIDLSDPEGPGIHGRIVGCNTLFTVGSRSEKANSYWRRNGRTSPNIVQGIPKGNEKDPWKYYPQEANSYYFRAWKVSQVLGWMQEHIGCRNLVCMQDALLHTPANYGEGEFEQKRRRGSRWYASIYMMMQDLWNLCNNQDFGGTDRVVHHLKQVGEHEAAKALVSLRAGKLPKDIKNNPFPWWQAFKMMSFHNLYALFKNIKDELPPVMLQVQLQDYLKSKYNLANVQDPEDKKAMVAQITTDILVIPAEKQAYNNFNRLLASMPFEERPKFDSREEQLLYFEQWRKTGIMPSPVVVTPEPENYIIPPTESKFSIVPVLVIGGTVAAVGVGAYLIYKSSKK